MRKICECPDHEEFEAKKPNIRFIKGHNMKERPSLLKGRSRSEETKQKIRNSKKLNPYFYTEEVRQKMSRSSKNRPPISEGTRLKFSELTKKRWMEGNLREICSSKERSDKISKALTGKTVPKEVRQKISNSLKGRERSKEHSYKNQAPHNCLGRVLFFVHYQTFH